MRTRSNLIVKAVPFCLAMAGLVACSRSPRPPLQSWNPQAAAAYLDQREVDWMRWPSAARDHDTFCVSCHTVLPYALARPALRKVLAEQERSSSEQRVLENVRTRVSLWSKVGPYYSGDGYDDGKSSESRGTESVLNALILALHDAEGGRLNDLTVTAFQNMWALQDKNGPDRGSWSWLRFGMEPWEANDSRYYGAALAALAVGVAPENYRSRPEVKPLLASLSDYLNREFAGQSTANHLVLLWAATKVSGLIDADRQRAIVSEARKTQRSDGGWALSPLSWPTSWSLHSIVRTRLRSDLTRQDSNSDGYATSLMIFVLQQAGVPKNDDVIQRGLAWLTNNQNKEDGSWPSDSLTKRRDASSVAGHFMRDAATAYAVLALSEAGVPSKVQSQPSLSVVR